MCSSSICLSFCLRRFDLRSYSYLVKILHQPILSRLNPHHHLSMTVVHYLSGRIFCEQLRIREKNHSTNHERLPNVPLQFWLSVIRGCMDWEIRQPSNPRHLRQPLCITKTSKSTSEIAKHQYVPYTQLPQYPKSSIQPHHVIKNLHRPPGPRNDPHQNPRREHHQIPQPPHQRQHAR